VIQEHLKRGMKIGMQTSKLLSKIGNNKAADKIHSAAKTAGKAMVGKAHGEELDHAIKAVKTEMSKLHAAGQLIEATMLRRMLKQLTTAITAASKHEQQIVIAQNGVLRSELSMATSMAKLINMTGHAVHLQKKTAPVTRISKVLKAKKISSQDLEGALRTSDHLVTHLSLAKETKSTKETIAEKSLAELSDAMAGALMHAAKAKYMQDVLVKQQKVQLLGEEKNAVSDLQEAAEDSRELVREMLINGQDHSAKAMENVQNAAEAVATGSGRGKDLKSAITGVKAMIAKMQAERKAAGKSSLFNPLDILLSSKETAAARAKASGVPQAGVVTELELALEKLQQAETDRAQAKTIKKALKTELTVTPVTVEAPAPPPASEKTMVFVERSDWDASDVLFLLIGFCLCILGYRLYKPSQAMAGFIFAAAISFQLCFQLDTLYAYTISCVAGIVCAALCVIIYPLGVFILGANFGVVIALMLNGICFSRVFDDNTALWVVLSILGVATGLLVGFIHKHKATADAFLSRSC